MKFAVIIPVYGQEHYTDAIVEQIGTMSDPCDIDLFVVDNMGTYEHDKGFATIIRTGSNLKWCKGTNYGARYVLGLDKDYDIYLFLNNDVKLSPGFFLGLQEAFEANPGAGVIAPLYDNVHPDQNAAYNGPAELFVGEPTEKVVKFVDGTAMAVTLDTIQEVGLLDEEHFGVYGWGADLDYCNRVAQRSDVMVTYRSYLNHFFQGTARFDKEAYRVFGAATVEMHEGMIKKYGKTWREEIGL